MHTSNVNASRPVSEVPSKLAEPVFEDATEGPLSFFRKRIPTIWPEVAPLCSSAAGFDATPGRAGQACDDELAALQSALTNRSCRTRRPGDELEALLAGWLHFDSERRAVLRGAVLYLQKLGDDCGSAHEEQLVGAAVSAVLRKHG